MTTGSVREQVNIHMRRVDLEGLPEIGLPTGYRIRHSQPGDADAATWCRIYREAFPELDPPTNELWRNTILGRTGYAPEHVFFVLDPEGEACATASAMQGAHTREGYIHWLGVRPAHAGRRLGLQISLQVLHCFRDRGCRSAVLETQAPRLAAIRTYLQLGFRPLLTDASQVAHWAAVAEHLECELPPWIDERVATSQEPRETA